LSSGGVKQDLIDIGVKLQAFFNKNPQMLACIDTTRKGTLVAQSAPLEQVSVEILCFCSSDVRVDLDLLNTMFETLSRVKATVLLVCDGFCCF
jgi:hypothetical protein